MRFQYTPSDVDRFWSKVDRSGDCWLWIGGLGRSGYGQFAYGWPGTIYNRGSHCVAWELTYGPIPKGLFICHHCDTRLCVRPSHLFLGTPADNSRDMVRKGRQARGERLNIQHRARGERIGNARLTDAMVATIRQRYAGGATNQRTLARELGVSQSTIWRALTGATWATSDALASAHTPRRRAVLNEEQVRAIRMRHAAGGITQCALAAEYGVCPDIISRIVNRHIWKHIA